MTIREWREYMGWSQTELARRSGYDQKQLWMWERGVHTPKVTTAIDIAQAFGTTVEMIRWL